MKNKKLQQIDTRNLDYSGFSTTQANPIGFQDRYIVKNKYNKIARNATQKEHYINNDNFKNISNNTTPKQEITIRYKLEPQNNILKSYDHKIEPTT